ncbi:MAG TPA: serine/threonine-protein kinase [Mycobacteriales bacterium]|nr:serine/threonine-protein kinase [Mycobacteriales bacterium]
MGERTGAAVDLVLAGRYRLVQPVTGHAVTTLWRGVDEVLARPVAIRTLDRPDAMPGGADQFLDAAVTAGRLAHPRIASIYDASTEDGVSYVVSEWVDGGALVALLDAAPLRPRRATTVVAQVAEAIAHAHECGVTHDDLDTHNVLLSADGSIKVTDFALGALLRAAGQGGSREPAAVDLAAEARDVRSLGALLYACLTGRSAYGAEPELPLAPTRDGVLLTPRQVRAGVPRELDAVVVRILAPARTRLPALTTASEVVAALAPLPGEGPGAALPAPADIAPGHGDARTSRWVRLGIPVAVLGVLAAAALAFGYSLGELPRPPGAVSPLDAPASEVPVAPEAASTAAARIVAVRAFDPPPGDRQERDRTVPLATDGDASTAWETVRYRSADFGNLKEGVGLLFDLGSPVKVRSVEIAFAQKGVAVELRAAATNSDSADGFRVVAADDDAGERTTLKPSATEPAARFWLVWLTRLVKAEDDEGRFHAGIAEVAFGR